MRVPWYNSNKGNIYLFVFVFVLLTFARQSQAQSDPKYFNEISPGAAPKIFVPGKISLDNEFEFGSVFSNDRNEFYYSVETNGKTDIRMMRFENGNWSPPVKILVHDVYSYNDPFLTPDSQRLFFISDRSLSGTGPQKDYDIWYVERRAGGWSEPVNAGQNINTSGNEYYVSFTKNGKMYFSSNKQGESAIRDYNIYSSQMKNGEFEPAVKAGPEINTLSYEADVFVAPDESYVIFSANRPDGFGNGDLYLSFRKDDGTWTQSKNLGGTINTDTDDFCPYVSPDGKYLFYASRRDIYWVSMDAVIKNKID